MLVLALLVWSVKSSRPENQKFLELKAGDPPRNPYRPFLAGQSIGTVYNYINHDTGSVISQDIRFYNPSGDIVYNGTLTATTTNYGYLYDVNVPSGSVQNYWALSPGSGSFGLTSHFDFAEGNSYVTAPNWAYVAQQTWATLANGYPGSISSIQAGGNVVGKFDSSALPNPAAGSPFSVPVTTTEIYSGMFIDFFRGTQHYQAVVNTNDLSLHGSFTDGNLGQFAFNAVAVPTTLSLADVSSFIGDVLAPNGYTGGLNLKYNLLHYKNEGTENILNKKIVSENGAYYLYFERQDGQKYYGIFNDDNAYGASISIHGHFWYNNVNYPWDAHGVKQ